MSADETASLQPTIEALAQRLESVQEQLGHLRELATRAYEDTQGSARDLLLARRSADYEHAYASEPLISVRLGAFRGGSALFDRALASVRRQSYENWEAVIVLDGPDEEAVRRIRSLSDRRIRCAERPRNGPYPADPRRRWQVAGSHPFNEGFALARGAWIAPIDQDDEWVDDHLEVLLGAAARTRAELTYGIGRALVADDGEAFFGAWPPALGDFGFQAAIYHSSLVGFQYDVNSHLLDEPADWNLARRMLEAGVRFEFVERVVTNYYVDENAPGIDWWRRRVRT